MTNTTLKNTNILDVKVKNYGECGFCKDEDSMEKLTIPWLIWVQWIYITMKNHDREWSAVYWVDNGVITHYKIPKQEADRTNVEFQEDLGGNGIIHSHHGMGAFHSSQDDRHERNLYEWSIVLNSKLEFEACRKTTLPCGGIGYLDCDLYLSDKPLMAEENIIDTPTKSVVTYYSGNDNKSKGFHGRSYTTYPPIESYPHEITEKEKKDLDVTDKDGNKIYDSQKEFTDVLPCDTCIEYNCQTCDFDPSNCIDVVQKKSKLVLIPSNN